jgi:hypothetical protein
MAAVVLQAATAEPSGAFSKIAKAVLENDKIKVVVIVNKLNLIKFNI